MDRQKNMHHNNQNRQNSSTGTVPKARSNREGSREIVSRVVAPIVRDRPHHNITSNNLLLDWQHQHIDQFSPPDHGQRYNNRDSRPPSEGGFEQASPTYDLSVLPVVRPQIRKRNQSQSINMSGTNGAPQHSSSNTAIVLPTTPMMHPMTNGEVLMNSHNGNEVFSGPRTQDRTASILMNSGISNVDERLNRLQDYLDMQEENQAMDQSNDLNSPMNGMTNSETNENAMKRRELELKMDISNRKMQVLQNQHNQLLRIQASAKQELDKLKKHKQMEQQQLQQQQQIQQQNQQQQQPNQTNKVYAIQSMQQFDNANTQVTGDMQMHNQTDFSFQPVNPLMYSLQNKENIQNHSYHRENTNYNTYSDGRNRQIENNSQNHNERENQSIISDEVTSDNNLGATSDVNLNGDFSQLDDGLINISKRLFAVDAVMESRAELEALTNSAFVSAQNDYDDKLRELQSKKQQMDSLVADLQQLNKQAARDREQRGLDTSTDDIEDQVNEHDNNVQPEPQQTQPDPGANTPGPGVGEEIAQINAMKLQLTRLKEMMDTMKYIEARTGCSESQRSSSRQSSICEQSPSTVETANYPDSWASSTMKPNNVDNMDQVPYKALLSENDNLNSVSNWLDSDGNRAAKYSEAPPINISLGEISLETVQSLSQELREQASALSSERERLVAAQNHILSRSDRTTSISSGYSNRPEKRVNQVSQNHLQKSTQSSQEPILGPKERQQQLLKAQLEAKKRELEDLMKKDRDLSSRINQDAGASSDAAKQDVQSEVDGQSWREERIHNNANYSTSVATRKSSTQSVSTSDLESRNVRSRRLGSESTAITSLHDVEVTGNNNQQQQQQTTLPRNSSRQSNLEIPPVPPPMPDLSWRKGSQDSSNYSPSTNPNSFRPYEMNGTTQSQIWWQQRIAQLQAQLETFLQQSQSNSMSANQSSPGQSTTSNYNPALPSFYQQSSTGYQNPMLPVGKLGLYQQYCAPPAMQPHLPAPPLIGQFCPCNNALWQTVWMQQREIANIGSAVCSLQERFLQLTNQQQQSIDTSIVNNSTPQRTLTATNSNNPLTQHSTENVQIQQRAKVLPVQARNNSVNPQLNQNVLPSQNLTINPNLTQNLVTQNLPSNPNLVQNHPNLSSNPNLAQNPNLATQNFSFNQNQNLLSNQNQMLIHPEQILDADLSISSSFNNSIYGGQNQHNFANFENLNNSSQDLGVNLHNPNLQNLNNGVNLMNLCQNQHVMLNGSELGNVSNLTSAATTLNNQVAPGNRANNYWDNFRSYSRQNLLSGNTKTKELVFNQCPSPLVQRSHNTLRTAAPLCQIPGQKSNAQALPESEVNNQIADQSNSSEIGPGASRIQGRNVQEIQPDVLNINPNVGPGSGPATNVNDSSVTNTNALWNAVSNGTATNYPEIVQSHSSFSDVSQQNLKTNLAPKSTGANKKRSRMCPAQYNESPPEAGRGLTAEPVVQDMKLLWRRENEAQHKSTSKPFDPVREAVYSEVTALIAQNESRPEYLLQLIRDLRQVGDDVQRQNATRTMQDLVQAGPSMQAPPPPPTTSSSATEDDIVLVEEQVSSGVREATPLHHLAEAQSTGPDNNDQRCSSTSDAQFIEHITDLHNQGAAANEVQSSVFNQTNEVGASGIDCPEPTCSSYTASSMVRSSESQRPAQHITAVSASNPGAVSRPGADHSDVYSIIANAIISKSSTNSSRLDEAAGGSNEVCWSVERRFINPQSGLVSSMDKGSSNTLDNVMPNNEDLAEADQVRGSIPRDEMATSAVSAQSNSTSTSRPTRQVNLDNEIRAGDGPAFVLDEASGITPGHNGQDSVLPLPDLARVGPGGDSDAVESQIRSGSSTGLEHGLDRVPTRLSNGPWSPQPPANENVHDVSTQNSHT